MFLIILLLFSILQIYICKNQKSRKVTLMLPIISLIFFIILSTLLNDLMLSNTKNIKIISYLIDFNLEYIFLLFLIYVCLLFSFLPTMVFCSINIYYKNSLIKSEFFHFKI